MVHYRMAGPMLFHLHSRPGSAYCLCASGPIAHPMVPSSMVSWFINLFKTIKTQLLAKHHHFPICSHYFCWSFLVPQPPSLPKIAPGLVAMRASSVLSPWVLGRGGWQHGFPPGAWRQSVLHVLWPLWIDRFVVHADAMPHCSQTSFRLFG